MIKVKIPLECIRKNNPKDTFVMDLVGQIVHSVDYNVKTRSYTFKFQEI